MIVINIAILAEFNVADKYWLSDMKPKILSSHPTNITAAGHPSASASGKH